MELTNENVLTTLFACMYEGITNASQIPTDAVRVEPVMNIFVFDPKKLEQQKPNILALLLQLPVEFFPGTGDGYSFLRMPFNRQGEQWGEQSSANALYALGKAAGYVRELLPRELWASLPGGVPYLLVAAPQVAPAQ